MQKYLHSDKDLERKKERALTIIRKINENYQIDYFTCEKCGAKYTCPWVFDAYNVNGDCLAEK